LIDENIGYLYQRLKDESLSVRKNTLMVLSHLILNGMIKVKGQIFEIAKCIQDPNVSISDLAKVKLLGVKTAMTKISKLMII